MHSNFFIEILYNIKKKRFIVYRAYHLSVIFYLLCEVCANRYYCKGEAQSLIDMNCTINMLDAL